MQSRSSTAWCSAAEGDHGARRGSRGIARYDAAIGLARIYAKRSCLAEAEVAYRVAIRAKLEHQARDFKHAEEELEELAAVVKSQGRVEEAEQLRAPAKADRRRAAELGIA